MTTLIDDNGQEIQIEDVPLTKQSVSFFDTKIKGDFSLNFNIPFTSENKKKLNYYTPQQVGTVLDQTWTITRNGNRLSRGQLVLQGIKDEQFELFFIAGNAEWISGLIKETADFDYTSELDDELVSFWSLTEIDNSITRTRGIIYPLADWSYKGERAGSNWFTSYISTSSEKQFYQDYYPCVYLHTLVKKIFRQSGFLVNGSLFENKDFNSIIVAPGSELVTAKSFIDGRAVKASASANITFAASLTYYQIALNTLDYGRGEIYSTSAYQYTSDSFCTLEFRTSGIATFTLVGDVQIYVYVNGVLTQLIARAFNLSGSPTIPVDSILDPTTRINVNRGDTVTFYAYSTTTGVTVSDFAIEIRPVERPIALDWVRVSDWVKLKAIDVIKFVFTYFGCVSNYDNQSRTITINTLENLIGDEDWSEYVQSYGVEVQKTQSQNNLFTWKKTPQFEEYEDIEGGFGGGNLSTGIKQDSFKWYEAPFAPVEQIVTGRGTSRGNYLLPRIDLVELSDAQSFDFSSISDVSGQCQFNGTGFDIFDDQVVRVTNNSNYSFYGIVETESSTAIKLYSVSYDDFPFSAGTIFLQTVRYNNTPPRLMYVAPDINIGDVSPSSSYVKGTASETALAFGWFMKQEIGEPVDNLNQSLAIENTLNGLSHKDTYLKKVNNILGNPLIIAEMLLPESVFFNFKFDKFVYIKFKELSGRFFVKAIEEYKDARTVCRVELFQVD